MVEGVKKWGEFGLKWGRFLAVFWTPILPIFGQRELATLIRCDYKVRSGKSSNQRWPSKNLAGTSKEND